MNMALYWKEIDMAKHGNELTKAAAIKTLFKAVDGCYIFVSDGGPMTVSVIISVEVMVSTMLFPKLSYIHRGSDIHGSPRERSTNEVISLDTKALKTRKNINTTKMYTSVDRIATTISNVVLGCDNEILAMINDGGFVIKPNIRDSSGVFLNNLDRIFDRFVSVNITYCPVVFITDLREHKRTLSR